jgi:hypothetical protein
MKKEEKIYYEPKWSDFTENEQELIRFFLLFIIITAVIFTLV